MKILCKYPSRGRPHIFLDRLREYNRMAADPANIAWLVSLDSDDATMTRTIVDEALKIHPDITIVFGQSESKIAACNRDLPEYQKPWDVVLLASDDMFCVRQDWDELIRHKMQQYFPDTDGALWFWDGAQRKINTLECVGRKRWEASGRTLYHGSYRSFFCDNETTERGIRDGKLIFIEESIAHHHHPAWLGGMQRDATYSRNNPYWKQDEANWHKRRAAGYPG